MSLAPPDTDVLLEQAARSSAEARDGLMARHRDRLRKMVAWRLDPRVAARLDPSDVVQEVLAEADQKLAAYLRDRPLPFYPRLRGLAWERLATLHRRHVKARRRSVLREDPSVLRLPDESAAELAARLVISASGPSQGALRQELRLRVRQALATMADADREVLVLRHLEGLSVADTAAVMGVSAGAVKMRLLRALERMRSLLDEEDVR